MTSLNDISLQIHMTFLNHKDSVEWISSFKDDIEPLSQRDFDSLIILLEGIAIEEQANFTETLYNSRIPQKLQAKATDPSAFYLLIEQLRIERRHWDADCVKIFSEKKPGKNK